jgi:hypothetical protein
MRTKSLSLFLLMAASAGFEPQAAGAKEVPFKGKLDAVFTVTPLGGNVIFVDLMGFGTATHLGQFTLSMPHTVAVTPPVSSAFGEEIVFTAANGDTLTAEFEGLATFVGPGILSIVEEATITGGTGRFAGATGNFVIERVASQATMTSTGSFEGTISRP